MELLPSEGYHQKQEVKRAKTAKILRLVGRDDALNIRIRSVILTLTDKTTDRYEYHVEAAATVRYTKLILTRSCTWSERR